MTRPTAGPGGAGFGTDQSGDQMVNPRWDVDALLADPDTKIVVTCGSGGVGKTTTAAAMAVRATDLGRTVAVLTIDPARRLAQSIGLTRLDNTPRLVEMDSAGELWAMNRETGDFERPPLD